MDDMDKLRQVVQRYATSCSTLASRNVTPAELADHHCDERVLARWAVAELARRDAEQVELGKPMAWMTPCPAGHEHDYEVYVDEKDCRRAADRYADETGEDWAVWPLVKGGEQWT